MKGQIKRINKKLCLVQAMTEKPHGRYPSAVLMLSNKVSQTLRIRTQAASAKRSSPSLRHLWYKGNIYRMSTRFRKTRGSYSSNLLPDSFIGLLLSSLVLRYSYTVNVTAWPGATRMILGVIPL